MMGLAEPPSGPSHWPETARPSGGLGPAELDRLAVRLRAAGCVFAEDEATLLASHFGPGEALDAAVERRVAGEPLEMLLGWVDFMGLRIALDPGVFVPRQRSRALVGAACSLLAPGGLLADVCCGSGALGAAVLAFRPDVQVYAADIDPAAVRCAARNLPPSQVFAGDLFDALPARLRGRVDVAMANTPYVPSAAIGSMPREAREFEPRLALDGGADGLDIQRRVWGQAPGWLRPGGVVITEIASGQAPAALLAARAAGFEPELRADPDAGAHLVVARA